MWTYNYYNRYELYHHGVAGMRWGVRKARQLIGGAIRGIARKNHIYSFGSKKCSFINRIQPQRKSEILGNRIRSSYGEKIVHKYLNKSGALFVGVVRGNMSRPQRIMGYNAYKRYKNLPASILGYSIKLNNRRREAFVPPSHSSYFRRLR